MNAVKRLCLPLQRSNTCTHAIRFKVSSPGAAHTENLVSKDPQACVRNIFCFNERYTCATFDVGLHVPQILSQDFVKSFNDAKEAWIARAEKQKNESGSVGLHDILTSNAETR